MKKKVIFFGDSSSYISTILFKSFLNNLNNQFQLTAVVNTTPNKKNFRLLNLISFLIKKIFNPFDRSIELNYGSFTNYVPSGVEVIDAIDVNNINFIQKITKLKPSYAFLMGCPQIFKKDLINCFEKVVNFHNSFLPSYRGIHATAWAMTNNEDYGGYTFHYINENIDDGKIVLQERVKLDYSLSAYQNGLVITRHAKKKTPELLNLVFNNYNGHSQVGCKTYFGKKHKNDLLTFDRVEDIYKMQRLILIWGGVYILEKDKYLFATKIRSDGYIKRIKWLPRKIYSLAQNYLNLN